jgi:Tol biopolymer transport system component/DNA-binding winged helix-turn-helix (wHTH) protein
MSESFEGSEFRRSFFGGIPEQGLMPGPSSELYEFGPFRLDAGQRILMREQQRVALAHKTFDLLLLLVRSPGKAFSKQELMTALWPETFVEEANLSFQISTLRKALGDGGSRWIETVPRHGYRFAAEVSARASATVTQPAASKAEPAPAPTAPAPLPGRRTWTITTPILAGLSIAAAYLVFVRPGPEEPHATTSTVATNLTAYPGSESGPSLSPDGSQVAFSWNGPREDNNDIYVKLVGSGEPIRLTMAPERDESPEWSPDGGRIAFLRRTRDVQAEIYVIPALGGAERRVASFVLDNSRRLMKLSWSPDGKWVAMGGRFSAADPFGVLLVEVDGSKQRRLTTAGPTWQMDYSPAFSPDGNRVAFIRSKATKTAIFIQPLSRAMTPAGQPVQVVSDARWSIVGLGWTPDGRSLVYSWGGHLAPTRLERTALSPSSKPVGPPELLPFGERATLFSVGRSGRMVYATQLRDANFWKLDLARSGSVPIDPGLSTSTLHETTPSYSPDGTEVVFTTTRSGSEELWISGADGTNLRQMTTMGGPQCSGPDWAPDGRSIVFTSTREGTSDLYLLFPRTGEVRRLTTDPAEEVQARWSRDGQSIYFGANRSGSWEIWRIRADGTTPTQVTTRGGLTAEESPDRRTLYYAKAGSPSTIWSVPLDGGDDVQLLDGLSYADNFVVGDRGIYFLAVGDLPTKTSIDFFEFSTGRRATLAKVGKPWWSGIALSPDQRWLLVATIDRDGSDLMLVDRIPSGLVSERER